MAVSADSTPVPAILPRLTRNGCPLGVEPRLWREALDHRVNRPLALVTVLLALLDGQDTDPDLEDKDDDEPPLVHS